MHGNQQGAAAVPPAPAAQRGPGAPSALAEPARQRAAELAALPVATVVVGADGRILAASRSWPQEQLDGGNYLSALVRGLDPVDHAAIAAGLRGLLTPRRRPESGSVAEGAGRPEEGSAAPDSASCDSFASDSFEHDYRWRSGSRIAWVRLQATRVDDPPRAVVVHTPLPHSVGPAQELAWRARHDDLTDLPNRGAMLELIEQALAEAPEAGPGTALLLLDLDGFKTVNDSLGHPVGDALLREAGNRLVEQVRPGDAVGRLGGDQYLVLARGCDTAEAAALAFRLQTTFGRPFPAAGLSVPLSASIGVAVRRGGDRSAEGLLTDAGAAMYAAKAAGRDRIHLFSPGLRKAARERLEVATRLRNGPVDQFVVHYQPVVRLDTGTVEGVEALLRWQHPERGLLLPDAFLAVAEETGQLIPITRWLLKTTTRQAARWAAEGMPLRVAVNISARHFSAETLVGDVRAALRDSGLPPERLLLELTETSIAEDPTRAEDQLTVLRSLGVRVAIDDFGTGWSSLAQLLALPIGTLKIDRSLLTAAGRLTDSDPGAVLGAIVGLTRTLGIRSVAEGVETAEHLRWVRAAGCDLVQGWLLARPMPAPAVPEWVRRIESVEGDLCSLADRPS